MTALRFITLATVLFISACANENQQFADACLTELMAKDATKLTLKAEDLLAGLTKLPDGNVELKAIAIYGAGTSEERKMAVVCVASLDAGVVNVQRTQFDIETN